MLTPKTKQKTKKTKKQKIKQTNKQTNKQTTPKKKNKKKHMIVYVDHSQRKKKTDRNRGTVLSVTDHQRNKIHARLKGDPQRS